MSSAPLASQTATDHRAALWVATLLCLTFVIITLATRLHVRWKALGLDDYSIVVASLVGLSQFAVIIAGLLHGLGADVENEEKRELAGRLFLASQAVFIVTVFFAKSAVVSTIERLLARDMKMARLICYIFQALVAVGGLASLLAITIKCAAEDLLTQNRNNTCPDQTARWIVVSVVDGVSELCILGAFCWIIAGRQMKTNVKLTVMLLLGLRIGCPAFTSVHTHYIASYTNSTNPGTAVVAPLVWQQFAMTYSLLSALLIALKGFLASFDTAMGMEQTYASGSRSGAVAFGMKRMSKGGSKNQRSGRLNSQKASAGSRSDEDPNLALDDSKYSAQIFHSEEARGSSRGSVRSGISQHPMIKYEMQYSVKYEEKDNQNARQDS